MTRFKSAWARILALTTALALALLGVVGTDARAADPAVIDIATVNDFHGRIATAPAIKCLLNDMRAANPNTVFVSAGDLIGASTFESAVAQDQPTIDVMNALGLEVSALGNHEFDKGQADVNGRVIPAANWKYVSANIMKGSANAYAPYEIITKDDVRIAFIGAMTPELPSLVSPTGISGLTITSMVDSVNKVATQLTDGNDANGEADVLIVLVHDGAASSDMSSATGTAYGALINGVNPKVSAILSGHTHQTYVTTVGGRTVMQSASYGALLGHLTISYDKTAKTATVTKAENLTPDKTCSDPAVQAIVDKANADADVLGQKPLGAIGGDFIRGAGGSDRGSESTINNFIADVQKWAVSSTGAEIGFMNAGGVRTDLLYAASGSEGDGIVTFKEAALVQPFANTLVVGNMTGAQIKSVLEEQWQPEGSSRPMLKLGQSENLWYSFDPTAAKGQRITSIKVDGKPIDMARSYKVVANSFLMDGGDSFFTFAKATNKADAGWVDLDAMVEYFRVVSPVGTANPASPDFKQRSVGVTYLSDPAKVYQKGDQFSLDLTSLSMTNKDEPKPTSVTAKFGDLVLGEFPVDNTVQTLDLTGKAEVRFPITAEMLKAAGTTGMLKVHIVDNFENAVLDLIIKVPVPETPRPLPTTGGSAPIAPVALMLFAAIVATGLVVRNRLAKA